MIFIIELCYITSFKIRQYTDYTQVTLLIPDYYGKV